MPEIYIVKLRVRFAALLGLVLTVLMGLVTWHFWTQVEFHQDNSRFLLSATITGALALGTVGLFIFYLIAQYIVTPSLTMVDRMDAVPWWILKVASMVIVIGAVAFFVVRYWNLGEDEFGLLRKGNFQALEERIADNPSLLRRANTQGLTLIQVAYLENSPKGVRFLVDLGAPTANLDPSGNNPVIASLPNLPMLGTLLDCGIDPSAADADGIPAIHYAIRMPTADVLEMLVEAGADLDARNRIYRTALMQCIETGTYPMAGILIANGADLNAFDQRGDTALHIAVRRRSEEGVKLLLDAKADATVFNFIHMTPLHLAAQAGEMALTKLLADYLDDVDLMDEINRSPFELALTNRRYETATLLTESGADINRVLDDGKTVMHHAIGRREYAIVRFLLRAGARADIPDKEGRTVLDICKAKELTGLVEMIEGDAESSDL